MSRAQEILEKLEAEEDPSRCPAGLEVISTGIPSLDRALRIEGIPRGRITHIYGDTYCGTSVLSFHIIGSVCEAGGITFVADLDRSVDIKYLRTIAGSTDNIRLIRPQKTYHLINVASLLAKEGVDLLVIDSFAALPEIPHLDVAFFGQLLEVVRQSQMAVVLTNRTQFWAGKNTPLYGDLIDMVCPISIHVSSRGSITLHGDIIGHEAKINITRNRLAYQHDPIHLRLEYGKGFDVVDSRIDTMLQDGFITQAGSYYYYRDKTFQGREALREALNNNELQPFTRPLGSLKFGLTV